MGYMLKNIPDHIMQQILPAADYWPELLRFYCQTSQPDDPGLPFMASMWSYALANGELTGMHKKTADGFWQQRLSELPPQYLMSLYNSERKPDYTPLINKSRKE